MLLKGRLRYCEKRLLIAVLQEGRGGPMQIDLAKLAGLARIATPEYVRECLGNLADMGRLRYWRDGTGEWVEPASVQSADGYKAGDGLWHTYILTVDGRLFYAGMTDQPGSRLRGHLRDRDESSSPKAQYMRNHAGQVRMHVLDSAGTVEEVRRLERSLIENLRADELSLSNVMPGG